MLNFQRIMLKSSSVVDVLSTGKVKKKKKKKRKSTKDFMISTCKSTGCPLEIIDLL